jgi:hypothetical protein
VGTHRSELLEGFDGADSTTRDAEKRDWLLSQDLLAYCERDTWAMVKLLEVVRRLAGAQT